jgi:hypothetical protein
VQSARRFYFSKWLLKTSGKKELLHMNKLEKVATGELTRAEKLVKEIERQENLTNSVAGTASLEAMEVFWNKYFSSRRPRRGRMKARGS